MSTTKEKYMEFKIERLMENLHKRGMKGRYCKSTDELVEVTMNLVKDGDMVASGGSMTLVESGIKDMLASMPEINYLDRDSCKTEEEAEELFRKAFYSDVYFMSTNAITEDGILVNIDGRGNRAAALIFGPKKVVIIAGVNKITTTLDEALLRARTVSGPMNCLRLDRKTPCTVSGVCQDCLSEESICSQFVVTRKSTIAERIHIILVNSEFGF